MSRFRAAYVVPLALAVALATATPASGKTPSVQELADTVASMQETIASQQVRIDELQTTLDGLMSSQTPSSGETGAPSPLSVRVEQLAKRLDGAQSVLDLAPYLSVSRDTTNGVTGPNVTLRGANLFIQNGGKSGCGNLILGYDSPLDTWNADQIDAKRTGSHTLVIGDGHSWTGSGGIVNGWANTLGPGGGSILGGDNNSVNSAMGVIVGGARNHIESKGQDNTIGGGYANGLIGSTAFSVVSGGETNIIAGTAVDNVIGGGGHNEIRTMAGKGGVGTISGGFKNLINSENVNPERAAKGAAWGYPSTCDSISGGSRNRITAGWGNTICGGGDNVACADIGGTVSGGRSNAVTSANFNDSQGRYPGSYATVGGGFGHLLAGELLWAAGPVQPGK